MRKLTAGMALLLLIGLSSSAHAYGEDGFVVSETEYAPFEGADWLWASLSGVFGNASAGSLGMVVGYAAAGDCVEDPDDTSLLGDCFLHGTAEAGLGMLIAAPFGAAGGVYAYGELTNHNGNYWAALAGAAVGSVVALIPAAVSNEEAGGTASVIAYVTLPGLGATIGYALSNDTGGPDGAAHGALLIHNPETGFGFGTPNAVVGRDYSGATVVMAPLLSGRF